MKEISILEPIFFSEFKCTGSECRDHCCKGWDINLDKATVNKYLKSKAIDIKSLATDNIITTKKSYANWGKIKLSQTGNCAFLDENRLCNIHKKLGASALSPTCADYPRLQKKTKYEIRQSLTLSCPEAVKKLLSSSQAMLLIEKKMLRASALDASEINQETQFVNLLCTNILLKSGPYPQQGLYGIALLFMYINQVEDNKEKYTKIEHYYNCILFSLEQGEIEKLVSEIKPDYQLQWALLLRLQAYLGGKKGIRAWTTLQHYVNKLIFLQSDVAKGGNVDAPMQRLDTAWKEKVSPWLAERPHIMGNYLQYRMYNDCFPAIDSQSYLENLYLLTAEWFLIKSLFTACVELVGHNNEDDFINIIYSYHAVTKHDQVSDKGFLNEIEKTKLNDDLSLIYLLG